MIPNIRIVEGFPQNDFAAITRLATQIGGFHEASTRRQLEARHAVVTCLAFVGSDLAGYKIGYEERPLYFESWLGAVAPEYRRRGIARELMAAQHGWCRAHGYRIVSTVTEGSNAPMLIANLQAGFEVCGTFLDRRKILKVIQQKHLVA